MMNNRDIQNKKSIMKRIKSIWLVIICLFFVLSPVKSQFVGSVIDSTIIAEDVRKGSIVEYSLQTDANPGEEFRWEVVGGIIITLGALGDGTIANPSVIEFTVDLHTIEVQWQSDDSTSAFTTGSILVQKISSTICGSNILQQTINQWSMPTAAIDTNNPGFSICSGDLVGGFIVVNLTGAADFTFEYSIKSNGLKDETGSAINTEFHTITTSNDTAHIALPGLLTNPSTSSSKYYTIELLSMHDTFEGDGEPVPSRKEFTITVYPSVSISTIQSTKLNKR